MILWIGKPLALAIHQRQLAEHGGTSGVREEKLLDSAPARPQQLRAYGDPAPDLADLAATLAFGLAPNLPFVDGNKRAAHVCYRVFLALNDVEFSAGDEDKCASILAPAEGALTGKPFAAWLRQHIGAKSGRRMHEPRPPEYRARG